MKDPVMYQSVEDFLEDDHFFEWGMSDQGSHNEFWQSFQDQYPGKVAIIEEALLLLQELKLEQSSHADKASQSWEKLQARINRKPKKPYPWLLAASITILLMLSVGFSWWMINAESVKSGYGAMKEVILPDGSTVLLRANSELSWKKNAWKKGEGRHVWLDGEAYFNVMHLSNSPEDYFIVHAGEMNVSVLGTSFNLFNRRNEQSVFLEEGSVQLSMNDEAPLILQPGEVLSTEKGSMPDQARKATTPSFYTSWTQHKWTFDASDLSTIAQQIKDNYGLEVEFEDSMIKNRVVTGTVPANNLDVLLEALQVLLDIDIVKEKERLIFS
ncbi:MAG: FecR domain-containing protein [Chitinophagales bacterium]|nr:FecR domain-containing protein [Chitinophagales bacterium]